MRLRSLEHLFFSVFYVALFLCLPLKLLSVSPPFAGTLPWMTGPLLTPSARIIPPGHVNLEPYLFYRDTNGDYNAHWKVEKRPHFYRITPLLNIKAGIYERISLSCILQWEYKHTQHVSGSGFGDLPLGIDIQLIEDKKDNIPVKFSIIEIFPTGKYQHLSPSKLKTDASGNGSFITVLAMTMSKLFYFQGEHYLNARLNIATSFPAQFTVKGFNLYGGYPDARGKVLLGKEFSMLCSAEYSFTRNWVFAIDLAGQFVGKTCVTGYPKSLRPHLPSRASISIAPAIEYNFNKDVGIIVGSWFTLAGRNSQRFLSTVGALNWYF